MTISCLRTPHGLLWPQENESDVIVFPGHRAPERQHGGHLAMPHFHVKGRRGLTEAGWGRGTICFGVFCAADLSRMLTVHPASERVSSQAAGRDQEGLSGTLRAGLGGSGLSAAQGAPASPRTRRVTRAGAWHPQLGSCSTRVANSSCQGRSPACAGR